MTPQELLDRMARDDPDLVALARIASLAVRVDRPFLRRARLGFVPGADAATEAKLWFGDLAEVSTGDGFVLREPVRKALHRQLEDELHGRPARVAALQKLLDETHGHLAPAIKLEERLTLLALSGAPQEELRDRLAAALVVAGRPGREGIAAWFDQASTRLPDVVLATESARRLERVSQWQMRRRRDDVVPEGAEHAVDWTDLVTVTGSTRTVPVRLFENAIELGGDPEQAVVVEMPTSEPFMVEVSWTERSDVRTRLVRIDEKKPARVSGSSEFKLRFADGQEMTFAPEAASTESAEELVAADVPLFFLGAPGVGKTSIARQLLDGAASSKESTLELESEVWRLEGEGVAVAFDPNFELREPSSVTTRVFLKLRAVYVLVLNAGKDADAIITEWLDLLAAPLIVAINTVGWRDSEFDAESVRQRFPDISAIVDTSAAELDGLDDLREEVLASAHIFPRLEVPASWMNVALAMRSRSVTALTTTDFRRTCLDHGVFADAVPQVAEFLDRQGVAVYLPPFSSELPILLSPRTSSEILSTVLASEMIRSTHGEVSHDDIESLFASSAFPESARTVIALLEKFDLCLLLDGTQDRFLIPELLPDGPLLDVELFDDDEPADVEYHYSHLPEDLIARFIALSHRLSKPPVRWKWGVILEVDSSWVMVDSVPEDSVVRLRVKEGDSVSAESISMIRGMLEKLHEQLDLDVDVELRQKEEKHEGRTACVVLIPFGVKVVAAGEIASRIDFDAVYEKILVPAIESVELPASEGGGHLRPVRPEEDLSAGGNIAEGMFESLESARFVIAEVSTANPNVLADLGLRLRSSVGGTLVLRHAHASNPFDNNQVPMLTWSMDTPDQLDDFRFRVTNFLQRAVQKSDWDSPLMQARRAPRENLELKEVLRKAEEALREGDEQGAHEQWLEAARLEPENPLHDFKASAYPKSRGDWDRAIELLEQAIVKAATLGATDGGFGEAHRELGIAQHKRDRLSDPRAGEESLRKAVALSPNDFNAWTALGSLLRRVGDDEGALHAFEEAVEVSDGHPRPLLLAMKYRARKSGTPEIDGKMRKRLEDAASLRQAQVNIRPPFDVPWSFFDLAEIAMYLGDEKACLETTYDGLRHCTASWMPQTFLADLEMLSSEAFPVLEELKSMARNRADELDRAGPA